MESRLGYTPSKSDAWFRKIELQRPTLADLEKLQSGAAIPRASIHLLDSLLCVFRVYC